MKPSPVNLDDTRLRLANPSREQRNVHRVGQRLPGLVDVKWAGIRDVPSTLFRELLRSALKPVTRGKLPPVLFHELGRHVAIKRVHDDPLRVLSQGKPLWRTISWRLDVGHQPPSAN